MFCAARYNRMNPAAEPMERWRQRKILAVWPKWRLVRYAPYHAMNVAAHPQLPPGPRMPSALQTLGWGARPLPFMERCRERYGGLFTLRIRNEYTWVFLSDPEDIKKVFTGD